MLTMLDEVSRREYPADYLLSRIRGRRVALWPKRNADSGMRYRSGEDDRQIWDAARTERRWLFGQMNNDLRSILAPLFVYFEVNTMVLALRYLTAGQLDKKDLVLERSLLGEEIKGIFRSRDKVSQVLARFERYCQEHDLPLEGLGAGYEERGLQKSEEMLRSQFLFLALHTSSHGGMAAFFRDIIDMRNLLVLARCLRWKITPVPSPVAGGQIEVRFSGESVTGADLSRMIRRWTRGGDLDGEQLHPIILEPVLQSHLLRKMKRLQRLGDPVVVCIEYIWRIFVITRERSILFHGGVGAEREFGLGGSR